MRVLRLMVSPVIVVLLIVVPTQQGAAGGGGESIDLEPLVVEGTPTLAQQWPSVGVVLIVDWAAVVLTEGASLGESSSCTSSLVAPLWVLTSATCVVFSSAAFAFASGALPFDDLMFSRDNRVEGELVPDADVYVLFGADDVGAATEELFDAYQTWGAGGGWEYDGPFVHTGLGVVHPDFRVIVLAETGVSRFPLANLALVPLRNAPPAPTTAVAYSRDLMWPQRYAPATVIGYGTLTEDDRDSWGVLREGGTRLQSAQVSAGDEDQPAFCHLTEYVPGVSLCASAGTDGRGALCLGDGGAPLLMERFAQTVLIGVASVAGAHDGATAACGVAGQPDNYTSVAAHEAWIHDVTAVVGAGGNGCPFTGHGTVYPAFVVPCWLQGQPHDFADVSAKPQPYFADAAIRFLWANAITTGTGPISFSPDDPVIRGDLAAFLYRLAGPTGSSAPHPFQDVVRGYQQQPVSWLFANGLTTGSPAGSSTFRSDDTVTRAEMVTFLWRLAGSPSVQVNQSFIDVVVKGNEFYAATAIAWAAELGITTGSPAGSRFFKPDDPVTRAEVAAFLHRFVQLV